jgi:putative transposase
MPWKGVTVSEQKQRFIEDFLLNYYSITDLAQRFCISRKTAHKWINRYLEQGPARLEERSRRPKSCPWQTDAALVAEIVEMREKRPSWGPKKILNVMGRRDGERSLPSVPTAARILSRAGLVKPRRRYRRAALKGSSASSMLSVRISIRSARTKESRRNVPQKSIRHPSGRCRSGSRRMIIRNTSWCGG